MMKAWFVLILYFGVCNKFDLESPMFLLSYVGFFLAITYFMQEVAKRIFELQDKLNNP